MKKLVVFASGNGTNAENIIKYGRRTGKYEVAYVAVNKPDAYVIKRAEKLNVPVFLFDRKDLYENGRVLDFLKRENPDLIVLAGFLWLIPSDIVSAFEKKIINIHPALLPKYGGKGMYANHVHEAVKKNGEKETGITIHYVDEKFDNGDIIFQKSVKINPEDTPEDIASKVHDLEYIFYPKIIVKLISGCNK
jgi:phosphoribosylglycinamide formyltransferase-1